MEPHKITRKVTQVVSYTLAAGDEVVVAPDMGEWSDITGKVTHVFDGGRRAILDDDKIIYTNKIKSINGYILEGEA